MKFSKINEKENYKCDICKRKNLEEYYIIIDEKSRTPFDRFSNKPTVICKYCKKKIEENNNPNEISSKCNFGIR